MVKRVERLEAFDLLEPQGFFSDIDPAILREVSRNSRQVLVPAGNVLFKQGEPSDSLYIVSTGRLDISVELEGQAPTSIFEAGRGQIVKAYVILKDGFTGDAALTRVLQEHVKTTVAPYKYPRAIEYVTALPRTETGKLRRVELRRIAAETAAKLVTQGE